MSKELNKAPVEQAGGDERAAFEVWIHTFDLPPQLDGEIFADERYPEADCFGQFVYDDHSTQRCWAAWQARAALAQPSPKSGDYSDQSWINAGCPPEQPEQAEAERPEVVARVVHSNPIVLGQCGPLNANDELMTVAQHAASVARWAEMFNRVEQERDAALARVAELTATRNRYGVDAHYFNKNLQRILRDFESFTTDELARSLIILAKVADEKVVAQAQHSVPGDIMRDAQRYRWLRDQQFYFSFSTENSDAGISSCTAGMSSRFKNLSWVDAAIDSAIAAAPGKEVGHE
ncbi:hypothetical protein Q8W87_05360 [Pseudomonas aeruginosa]|uniref:hypothetical protein n=1 Tax=Pseudomonas aeruginosa TaxID=287 RepID=UPI0029044BDA|nr:hypothetical protein [Pseudomonas aeruginosa]MDU0699507.1 hypothetical protein [Pseudomonas aeruginosa]